MLKTRLRGCSAALFGIGLTLLLGPALVAAAPVVTPVRTLAPPALVPADFTITYSYDQNGNRTTEVGPSLPQQSGTDSCGNGTSGYVPMFLGGQIVSVFSVACP